MMFLSLKKRVALIGLLKDFLVFCVILDLISTYVGITKFSLLESNHKLLLLFSRFGIIDALFIKFFCSVIGIYIVYFVLVFGLKYFRKICNKILEDFLFEFGFYMFFLLNLVYIFTVFLNSYYIFMLM